MKKTLFSLMLMLTAVLSVNAQRSLEVKDLTIEDEIFGDAETAGLVIICDKTKPLSFESNLDSNVPILQQQEQGDKTVYYLQLDASDTFRGRQLSVNTYGYYTLVFVPNLKNGYVARYEVYDPNNAVDGTRFQTYREKGLQYFDDCSYLAAKEQFELAKMCEDIGDSQRAEAQLHINDCDSIFEWRRLGNEAANMLDYATAMDYFLKAQTLNSQDRYAVDRYQECSNEQAARSTKYMDKADAYFKDKDYEDAVIMYKKVEALRDNNVGLALSRRIMSERMLKRRKNANTSLTFEFNQGDNKLYGLSIGSYRNRTGGYFTIKGNDKIIDFIRGDYRLVDIPEVDVSAGWTMPLIKKQDKLLYGVFQGLYIQFTPFGVALLNKYSVKKEDKNNNEIFTDAEKLLPKEEQQTLLDERIANGEKAKDLIDQKIKMAVTPEIGATLKIWRVTLRATYQYRIAFNKEDDDLFQKRLWNFGVGFSF